MPDALPLQDGRGHAAVFGAYRNSCINRQKIFWDPPIHCTMVRRGDDKLTVYHGEGVDDVVEGELYNFAADPHERRNLWTDPSSAALRAELTALVIAWDRREGLRRSGAPVRHVFPPAKKWLRNNPIRLVR
jgi:arylsulfatase A-like enzyme